MMPVRVSKLSPPGRRGDTEYVIVGCGWLAVHWPMIAVTDFPTTRGLSIWPNDYPSRRLPDLIMMRLNTLRAYEGFWMNDLRIKRNQPT